MTHLSDESVIELVSGEGAARDLGHAAECVACAQRVREARDALELLERAGIPEPPPVYWDALRSGVQHRIAEERRRFSLAVLGLPLAAAAALVAALWISSIRRAPAVAVPALPAWSALPSADDDEGLRVLEGVALTNGTERAWDQSSGLAPYVAGLSDEESRALAEALHARGGES
jgi:predicted outer membrane lipoprotein